MAAKPIDTAYVLVNTEIGCETEALGNVRKVKNVKQVQTLRGVYDGVALVEAVLDELKETVNYRMIRGVVDKLTGTLSLVVLRDKKGNQIGFKKDLSTGETLYENIPDITEFSFPNRE